MSAGPCSSRQELAAPPARTQVDLDGFAGELGDGDAAPLRLMAKACVEILGELDGRSLHVCQHTRCAADADLLAPLCQAIAGIGVVSRRGPGCSFTEEPAIGVGPATLVLGVVPTCPPGPR